MSNAFQLTSLELLKFSLIMMWEKLGLEIHLVFPCPLFQVRKETETAKGTNEHFKTAAAQTLWQKTQQTWNCKQISL